MKYVDTIAILHPRPHIVDAALESARELVRSGKRPTVKESLYLELRKLMTSAFYSNCAICESPIVAQRKAHLDHYRPKLKVTDDCGVVVKDGARKHPGYWWLAYRPDNLIPLCIRCNTYLKRNRFPLAPGGRYVYDELFDMEELNARERPLLLNPYYDEPDAFLDFDYVKNEYMALDGNERAQKTIELFELNSDSDLCNLRKSTIGTALSTLQLSFISTINDQEPMEIFVNVQQSLKQRSYPFSFATVKTWTRFLDELALSVRQKAV